MDAHSGTLSCPQSPPGQDREACLPGLHRYTRVLGFAIAKIIVGHPHPPTPLRATGGRKPNQQSAPRGQGLVSRQQCRPGSHLQDLLIQSRENVSRRSIQRPGAHDVKETTLGRHGRNAHCRSSSVHARGRCARRRP